MTLRNHRIRLAGNSAIKGLDPSRVTYSSQLTAFPYSNSQLDHRSKVFKFSGRFKITASNKHIYINDGAPKDVSLDVADYATPTLLAAHIQTKLNAASSNWTCTYSTSTFKFTITHNTLATLSLSNNTNALWDTIGFTTGVDIPGTSFTGDQQRNHTTEEIVWDLGSSTEVSFFAMLGLVNQTFNISDVATIKLYANSLNSWATPPLDVTLTRSDRGVFHFLDDLATCTYRWWKLEITDRLNPIGPNLSIAHIYAGNYLTFTERDIGHGYNKAMIDSSVVSTAEGGALYFDLKPKFAAFTELRLDILKRDDKDALEAFFYRVGKTVPFYCSIDPTLTYTDDISELTKFVYFSAEPSFNHTFRDMFSTAMNVREVV